MQGWRDEHKDQVKAKDKANKRIRQLWSFRATHYLLLALSTWNTGLALFAIVNTDASFRPGMALLCLLSFFLGLYLLLAHVGK